MRVRNVRRWSCSRSPASMAVSGVCSTAGAYGRRIPTDAPGGYRRHVLTFACFDVETTGLDPDGGRVIEVAVVRIQRDGTVVGEWTTLVDAGDTDLGRIDIHGIRRPWLADAPGFGAIAGDLAHELSGCVPVAHNARFDVAFLRAEWNRSGLGSLDLDAVDTLQMARQLGYPGRLARLAEALGVPLVDAHQALDDTRALACVLVALLDSGGVLPSPLPAFWPPLLTPAPSGQVALRPTPVA